MNKIALVLLFASLLLFSLGQAFALTPTACLSGFTASGTSCIQDCPTTQYSGWQDLYCLEGKLRQSQTIISYDIAKYFKAPADPTSNLMLAECVQKTSTEYRSIPDEKCLQCPSEKMQESEWKLLGCSKEGTAIQAKDLQAWQIDPFTSKCEIVQKQEFDYTENNLCKVPILGGALLWASINWIGIVLVIIVVAAIILLLPKKFVAGLKGIKLRRR